MSEQKIILRPISIKDTNNIIRWRNSAQVKKYFIYQKDLTREEHLLWLENKVNKGTVSQFIIHDENKNIDVGSVYLRDIDNVNKRAEFGIFIGEEDCRGKGYGKTAIKQILEYAFNVLKLHKVYLRVLADNDIAINGYRKAGFEIEEKLKDDVIINGDNKKVIWMSIINERG